MILFDDCSYHPLCESTAAVTAVVDTKSIFRVVNRHSTHYAHEQRINRQELWCLCCQVSSFDRFGWAVSKTISIELYTNWRECRVKSFFWLVQCRRISIIINVVYNSHISNNSNKNIDDERKNTYSLDRFKCELCVWIFFHVNESFGVDTFLLSWNDMHRTDVMSYIPSLSNQMHSLTKFSTIVSDRLECKYKKLWTVYPSDRVNQNEMFILLISIALSKWFFEKKEKTTTTTRALATMVFGVFFPFLYSSRKHDISPTWIIYWLTDIKRKRTHSTFWSDHKHNINIKCKRISDHM